MKVYITRKIPKAAEDHLKKKKYSVEVYPVDKPIPRSVLLKKVKDIDALIPLLSDKIDKEVIDKMDKCKVIANYAVGYNNIDVDYAKKKGITVTNTPDVLTESTADIALALTLACARKIVPSDKYIRAKKFKGWKPMLMLGVELNNKVFGIAGAGRIGTAVAQRAKAFGTKIIYYDKSINVKLEKETGAKKVSLKTLFKKADIISLHLPLTEKTDHIINKQLLSLMKERAILINTARGEIVDEKELIKLLKKNKLFSAGFDVYEGEPEVNPELFKLDNTVLLPHIGSATYEARNEMALLAAKNVSAVLSGKEPLTGI